MRVKLKGVYAHRKRLSDGTLRTYYTLRGFGALKPLPQDEGEPFDRGAPAFMRAYHAAIQAPRKIRTSGTLQSIIDGYQRSVAFARLAPRSKKDYLEHIAKIERAVLVERGPPLASYPIETIDDAKIRKRFLDWRDQMALTSPRQADATFGVLRIILEWGRDRGMLANNHATRPKKVYKADRSDKIWLEEHLAAFRRVASPEMRLALELALYTGQRQGDLLRLEWASYTEGRLSFRQGKRNRKVDQRVHETLRAILDNEERRAATILTTPSGKPWGKVHFQHHWRRATLEAGLDGLHFHDLRGTHCTMLADAGCTGSEIAAMLGWSVGTVNTMLDRYQAMTAAQSDSAVAKLEARQ